MTLLKEEDFLKMLYFILYYISTFIYILLVSYV